MKRDLGKIIAKQRKNKGLTQQELADLLYCSKELVGKIETGNRSINTELLIQLSGILDFNFVQYSKNFLKYKTSEHYDLVQNLIELLSASDYEELEKNIKCNPIIEELDYGSPVIIREYCKSLVLVNIYEDYSTAQQLLFKVLGFEKLKDINSFTPSFNSEERYYSCIALLSVVLCMKKEIDASLILVKKTINFLEMFYFNKVIPKSSIEQYYKHLYIVLLNNQADILYNLDRYDEAALICAKIQEIMISFESYFALEKVLKLKVQIMSKQGLNSIAQDTYEEFFYICKLKNKVQYLEITNEYFNSEIPFINTMVLID